MRLFVLKRFLRPLWHRRHRLVISTKHLFGWTFSSLGQLPLPDYLKQGVRDVTMLSLEHMVIHTDTYRNWQRERAGTSRIQRLMSATPASSAHEKRKHHPVAPTPTQWDALPVQDSHYPADVTPIDVIVPVYRDYDQTLNAIYQALATRPLNTTPYHVIVINDATPEVRLKVALEELAERGLFELHTNAENLGFVATVNKGMGLHPQRDMLLLNADTEVYNHWVDRLAQAAQKQERIASVTPLSNNAEICSYPYFVQDNELPLEVSYKELDAMAATSNPRAVVEIPTGVGFCMLITRAALNEVGYFDVERFGKGYGEENDFCMRAIAKGWTHVMACDTFVRHIGGSSFGASKRKRAAKAYDILLGLYPDYGNKVHAFINADPVLPYRRALDVARFARAMGAERAILMVNHQMGGGTGRHVQEMSEALSHEGIGALVLEPSASGHGLLALKQVGVREAPNLTFSMEYDREALLEVLRALGVFHMHIHHVVNFPQRILDFLTHITHALHVAYDVTVHDYYTICPRINLVDRTDRYCGEPDITACERCIETTPSHAGGTPVWQWRGQFEKLLVQARKVFVPSADVQTRMGGYYPSVEFALRPHAESFDTVSVVSVARRPEDRVRVAVIGAISLIKGSQVLVDAIRDANARDLPVEYVLIGHSDHPDLNAGMQRFTCTGEYKEFEIGRLLEKHAPHLAFIPSVWPETYCYTLSIALRYGIRPAVFDMGAPAERLRVLGDDAGEILPCAWMQDVRTLNDHFCAYFPSARVLMRPENVWYPSLMRDYYGLEQLGAAQAATQEAA
jgi:O-antigen biosynthesis protein